jgi:hypothetical protein
MSEDSPIYELKRKILNQIQMRYRLRIVASTHNPMIWLLSP